MRRRVLLSLLGLAVAVAAVVALAGGGDDPGGEMSGERRAPGVQAPVTTPAAPGDEDDGEGSAGGGSGGDSGGAGAGGSGGAGAGGGSGGSTAGSDVPRLSGGTIVGIGEHGPAMFDDPRFLALGIRHARLVTAYDTTRVDFERDIVDTWLAGARRAGVEPFITFGHSRVRPRHLPTVAEFRARFREFRRRWPQVRVYAAWNEVNHASQPTHDAPARAADFYDVVRAGCPGCTVVAGDLLDEADLPRYLATYKRHLDSEPTVWGLHNYADTNRFRSTGLRRMLARTNGELWLTETGGILRFGRSFPASARRQARAVEYTFRLAQRHPRVRRVYLYNWTGAARDDRFDAGMTTPSGALRPAYHVVRRALGR